MTEDDIKKYFLGELNEAAADSFEEEVARSAELFEQARIVENDIIDDFLQGRLSSAEQALFEENYLTTPARHQKIKFSGLFLSDIQKESPKIAQTAKIKEHKSFRQNIVDNFQLLRVFAFGTLAIIFFGGFFLIWLNRESESDTANQQNSNQSPLPENQSKSNLSDSNSKDADPQFRSELNTGKSKSPQESNSKKITPTPEPTPVIVPTQKPVESSKPIFASFTLAPGMLRDGGEQAIKIPAETGRIRLHLNFPKDSIKYRTYRATIKTAEGETVFSVSNLSSLDLVLPAAKLSSNTYVILLEGNSPSKPAESVAEYTFRVER